MALAASGQFVTITLTPKFLYPLVFSKFSEQEVDEREIEKVMYLRLFPKGFADILNLAKKFQQQNNLDKALKLLELCSPRNLPPDETDPKLNRDNAYVKRRFRKELEEFSYYIPPNFPWHLATAKVPPYTQKIVENLVLNIRILRHVQKNEYFEVLAMEK